jgi:hypothetical protein
MRTTTLPHQFGRAVFYYLLFFRALQVEKLNIQIPDRLGMRLDELLARVDRVAHEHVKGTVCFGGIIHGHEHQGAIYRVHGGFPQLLRIHLAQALVAGKAGLILADTQGFEQLILLSIVIGVMNLVLMHQPVKWWLGDVEMPVIDQSGHVAEEKC